MGEGCSYRCTSALPVSSCTAWRLAWPLGPQVLQHVWAIHLDTYRACWGHERRICRDKCICEARYIGKVAPLRTCSPRPDSSELPSSPGPAHAYRPCKLLTHAHCVLQGMYQYGVEMGIIQDGEIPEIRMRGKPAALPLRGCVPACCTGLCAFRGNGMLSAMSCHIHGFQSRFVCCQVKLGPRLRRQACSSSRSPLGGRRPRA